MVAGFCLYSPRPESLSSSHSASAPSPHNSLRWKPVTFSFCRELPSLPSSPITLHHRKKAIWFFFPGLGILYPGHLWKIDPCRFQSRSRSVSPGLPGLLGCPKLWSDQTILPSALLSASSLHSLPSSLPPSSLLFSHLCPSSLFPVGPVSVLFFSCDFLLLSLFFAFLSPENFTGIAIALSYTNREVILFFFFLSFSTLELRKI